MKNGPRSDQSVVFIGIVARRRRNGVIARGWGEAPSNLAAIGRYILTPEVIAGLGRTKQDWGREIQRPDATADQARSGASGVLQPMVVIGFVS